TAAPFWASWRYDPLAQKRDLRLDLLRGLFLVYMILYHFHHSWVVNFTYERLGSVSAAEGFVFLSGMVVGLVYLPMLQQQGFKVMAKRVWRRATHIYLADVVPLTALILLDAFVLPLKPVAKLVEQSSPVELAGDVLTLHIGTFGFDILLLYILLLF